MRWDGVRWRRGCWLWVCRSRKESDARSGRGECLPSSQEEESQKSEHMSSVDSPNKQVVSAELCACID